MNGTKAFVENTLPNWGFWIVRSLYGLVSPAKESSFVLPSEGLWMVIGLNGNHYYTSSPKRGNWLNLFETDIVDKYTLDGFVTIEPDDIVIDVGAFVGGFSIRTAEICEKVIAIEPGPQNRRALHRNLQSKSEGNYEIVDAVLWSEKTELEFDFGKDPTDHSVLGADDGSSGQNKRLTTTTLDSIAEEFDVDIIDFLKIDAEGAEPEVLDGADSVKIRKLAVDCSAERNGENTFDEVQSILTRQNYSTRRAGEVLFACDNN